MYYNLLQPAWKQEPVQVMILMYVLEHTDLDTKVFIRTNARIQKDLGLSQPSVTSGMRRLEELNAITRLPFNEGWKVNVPLKRPSDSDDIQNNVLIPNYGL